MYHVILYKLRLPNHDLRHATRQTNSMVCKFIYLYTYLYTHIYIRNTHLYIKCNKKFDVATKIAREIFFFFMSISSGKKKQIYSQLKKHNTAHFIYTHTYIYIRVNIKLVNFIWCEAIHGNDIRIQPPMAIRKKKKKKKFDRIISRGKNESSSSIYLRISIKFPRTNFSNWHSTWVTRKIFIAIHLYINKYKYIFIYI